MAAPIVVRQVAPHDKVFFEFPWTLYRNDPNWVPPLLSMRHELLDRQKNPAWEYMEGEHFVAWRADQPVGTITAFINHRHNEYWNERVGWFGSLDVIDDQEVVNALLKTAEDWVRSRGYPMIRGPQTFTTHEDVGLQIDGFGPPVLMMPYHKPYMQALVENSGYKKSMDVISMFFSREMDATTNMRARLKKIADRAAQRGGIVIRRMDTSRKQAEFRVFRDIFNSAWDKNWGFVPMNDKELDALVRAVGMFVEPEMAFFAEIEGKPAGFALAMPDFNELLLKAYPRPGVPEVWSLIKVLWHWKVRKTIKGLRLPLMGVKAEYRDRGVDLALLSATYENIPERYSHIDAGWILEINELVKISLKLGANPYRTHRLYEKEL
jgi:GNAT superfamily N-acetyltransferase